uniref:EF-1-gamma C-terminal domain-containing protein n=1 Tax=Schistocephalus solidus TaxID=70667 RepID=A0A183TPM3_SCHSO
LKPFAHFNHWFITVANQPQVLKVAGAPKLCTKAAFYDPKKHKKHMAEVILEISIHNSSPFASLPIGTFDYDTFECTYSNNDIKLVTSPFFWEKMQNHAYKENNNSTISGVWVGRGTVLVIELSEDLQIDYE